MKYTYRNDKGLLCGFNGFIGNGMYGGSIGISVFCKLEGELRFLVPVPYAGLFLS